MLSNFLSCFKVNKKIVYTDNFYQDYFDNLGGMQFGGCLFNAFRLQDVPKYREYIEDAFPQLVGKILPFGYTWDGICYCVDMRDGKVIMCDVGGGECIPFPRSMRSFLNEDLPKLVPTIVRQTDYREWISQYGMMQYGSCAGLKIPLFLGGDEENENREVSDLGVYWGVIGQVKRQVVDS